MIPVFQVQPVHEKILTPEQKLARRMGRPPRPRQVVPETMPARDLMRETGYRQIALIYDPEFWYPEHCWLSWLAAEVSDPARDFISVPLGNQNPEWRRGLDIPLYLTVPGLEKASRFMGPAKWKRGLISTGHETSVFVLPDSLFMSMPDGLLLKDVPDYLRKCRARVRIFCRGWLHSFNALGDAGARHDLLGMTDWKGQVLEFGCGSGMMARACKEAGSQVTWTGVDLDPEALQQAAGHLDLAVMADASRGLPISGKIRFDRAVCGDFLEHLAYPWQFLAGLREFMNKNGQLVASVPNIGHWSVVQDLLAGRLDEAPAGIMCVTHLRFGTKKTWQRWLNQSGWEVMKWEEERIALPEGWEDLVGKRDLDIDKNSLETVRYRLLAVPSRC